VRLIGATQDVTEKKKFDDELKRLSFIARETVNAVIITDPDGKIEWINEAFCNISGYTLAEVAGKRPGEFLQGPESSRLVIDYMRNQINKMAPFECEIINYSKNGRKYWVEIEGQPMFDKYGKLTHYFAIETNITERKMALQALKKSEEQYRYLFNNNPACIFIWYLDDFTIAEINDEVVKQYGYTKTEMYGMTILELRSASDFSLVRKFARKVLSEESFKATSVWKHLHKNGSQMFMQVTAEKIMYNGRPAIISLAINITDKLLLEKKLEEEKRDKEKAITQAVITAQEREREEIGRELHDNVNQILASSRLYLGLVRTEQEVVHPCIDETDKLINCAIEELRALSHSLIPPSLDEDDFIDALNAIVEVTMIGNTLHIEKDLEYFNESQVSDKMRLTIYRIIQEQFNNILKYAKASHVLLKLSNEGDVITLIIKDDGVGFDPAEKSNGVGLINIKTRASLLNGKMSIISAPGKGCELVVQFS
jgi:PAS domain S-box-containing protein